jgi:hypothetical protein
MESLRWYACLHMSRREWEIQMQVGDEREQRRGAISCSDDEYEY